MPGIKNLNCEEANAVEELQMRVKSALTPGMRDDATVFYRFLKAQNFNVDKAEKMLLKHITWRKIYQIDTILANFKAKEFFQKFTEPSLLGFDKDGDIVAYSATGKLNINEIFKSVKINDFMKHWYWFAEKYISLLKEHNLKTGKNGYQASLILDLDKLTIGNATSKLSINLFLRFTQSYQDNYPERMKSLYIINAPSYYVVVFSIVKSVMSNAMVKKIHVYGYSGWQEKLLEFVDADVLPVFLGGNRTDPDGNPMCKTFITFGGKIPEKYFLLDEERYFKDNTQVRRITVFSSEKKKIYVDVKEAGILLQWEFLVKGKDIGFGLSFQVSQHEVQEMIPVQRYDTSDGTEKDSYKCHSAGKYIILFDNSYSWLNAKEVEYCITLLEPERC